MCARQPTAPATTVILPDYFHAHGMVKPRKRQQPRPGDRVCTRCTYCNYARETRCRACRAANTATMALGDWLCPRCGNSNWSRHTKCSSSEIPCPVQGSEPGSSRRVVLGELVADDAPEPAANERRVLPVPYAPALRQKAPRHSTYRVFSPGRKKYQANAMLWRSG